MAKAFHFFSWQQDIICSGLQSHTITATAGENGSIDPEGEITVTEGDNQTFTFIADNGYEVDQLLIDEVNVPDSIAGGSYTFINVTEDHTIEVTFKLIPVTQYTISASAGENGNIDPEGEITVTEGDNQTFTFIADNGYEVDQLLIDNVNVPDSMAGGSYTFVGVTENHTIEVTFKPIPVTQYTITATAGENGSIDLEGEITVTEGDNQTFTFIADNGYEVDQLLIDEVNVPDSIAGGSYTFINVTEDHTIEVTFKPIPVTQYTISASAGENGNIDPEGEITVTEGDNQTFTFIADNGYEVDQLLIDEVNVPDSIAGGSYTFVDVTGNHTIAVIFKVIAVGEQMLFTWNATAGSNKSVTLRATAGKDFIVDWGDGTTNTYTGNGNSNVSITHRYNSTASYFVSVSAVTTDGHFTYLHCGTKQVTALDVSRNTEMTYLNCEHNLLSTLNVSQNTKLEKLYFSGNQLTALDVSKNTELTDLNCSGNRLTILNVSQNTKLGYLNCNNNQLTTLYVSNNTMLSTLYCSGNQLTALNLRLTTALENLECFSNQLTALDISTNTALRTLWCYNNQLTFSTLPLPAYPNYQYTPQAKINGGIAPGFVDLSSEYNIDGNITVYTWYELNDATETEISSGYTDHGNGTFTFGIDFDTKTLRCKMTNATFPDFTASAPLVYEVTINPTVEYAITATAGENGSIDPEGEITVTEGDNQTFTFIADNGYEVDQLLIDEVNVPDSIAGGSYTFINVTEDHSIEVTFKPIPVTQYTISASAGENGNIDPEGEITVTEGDNQTFTFIADNGYEVDQLLIDNVNVPDSIAGGSYTFVDVTEDHSIEVTFKPISVTQYTISASAGENGNIDPEGEITVTEGDNQTFTFIADNGYEVDQLLIDEVNVPDSIAGGSYTFVDVTGNHTIAVIFKVIAVGEQMLFTWNATAGSNKSVTLRATAGKDFIVDWGDGTTNTYTGNGNSNVSITHRYNSTASYFVSVSAVTTDGHFTYLHCGTKQVTALDVSRNTEMTYLNCEHNLLSTLNVSQNTKLEKLYFSGNQLTALDVSKNTELTDLNCSGNRLTILNVSQNTKLGYLNCNNNQLTTLYVSNNTMLSTLYCSGNQLTALNLRLTTALENLECFSNQLTALDISTNTALRTLWCYNNQLTFSTLPLPAYPNYQYTPQAKINGGIAPGFVDLSSEYNIDGNITVYTWYELNDTTETEISSGYTDHGNGTFTFGIDFDTKTLRCKMTNATFPDFTASAPLVYEVTINPTVEYAITATAGENGSIDPEGEITVTEGDNQTFTFIADNGYEVDQLLIDEVNVPDSIAGGSYTFINVTEDHSIEVTFKPIPVTQYTITATAGENGSIDPEGEITVTEGDNQTFTFIADNGYEVDQLLIDEVNVPDSIAGGSYTFVDVTEDHTIEVTFKPISVTQYTITATAGENGSIDPEGEITVTEGDNQTFTFIADNGYEVDQLLIDEVNVPDSIAGGSYTFVDVTEDHTIEVTFKPIPVTQYTITATAGENGSIDPEGEITVTEGDNQTFTFIADNGYEVDQLLIDEVNVPDSIAGGSYTFVDVTEDHTIEVTFKPIPVTQYTITATAGENGTIDPEGEITVTEGDNQTFTFTPSACYQIDQVLINGVNNTEAVANGTYTFTNVTDDQTIAVSFKLISYTITATAGEGGTITPSGAVSVDCGSNKTFTFTPSACCQIDQVLINGVNNAEAVANGTYTFTNVTDDQTIAVSFKLISYTITATAGEGGTIMPSGAVSVDCGSNKTFTFTPLACYQIDQVLINGVNNTEAVANGTYTFTNVTDDQTIAVSFKLISYTITTTAGEGGTITPSGTVLVDCGSNKTFTFTPSACYQIDQVLINGVNNTEAVANGTYTFTNVTDDQTIAVSFKLISYTITATAGEGGTIMPSGAVSVDCGSNKTFTFTPLACYQIDQVLINGVNNTEAVANGTYTFTNVTDDQTIAVSFKLISYTITATAGEGGTITPSGAVSVDCGSNKTFTFTPLACYQIDQVLINGVNNAEAVANGTYTFTNVTDDQTIAVSFKLISYTITATAGEGGTITPSGAVSVDCGSNKTFTFTPSACYQIDQVLINGVNNTEAVANGTYTFTNVTDDQTIAVSFKLISYTITATAGEGGTITPSGTVSVDCGSNKTFTFTPSACYQIDQVLINGVNNAEAVANGTYTFTNVTDDQTLAVSFKLISYTITATAGEGGTITPSGTVLVDCGSNKTFTFAPSDLYQIDQVLINGVNNAEAVANGTYTFTNVTDDQTIAVSFKLISYTITATAGEGGTITPSGAVSVDCGSDKTFTFSPSACYQVDQVLINGVNNAEAVANGTYTFTNVTDDQTIAVSFKLISYTITATAGEGGTITPSGAVSVDCGSNKTFTFTPSACYQIDQVLINGVNNAEAVANGTYTFTNVTDDQTIAVSFKLISYTITATAGEGGTITPSGTVSVDCGSNKTFTFTPSACYQVDQVLINGVNNAEAVANGTYTFTNVTDGQTIAVSFKLISYTITATAGEGGTITPSGTVSVDCGSDKTFTFTPSACYQVDQVLINGVNNAEAVTNGTYTFTNVTDDQTIAVSFKLISYTITATAGEGGTIMPSGAVSVDCGSDKTFTFAPSDLYQIDQVLINGENNPEAVAEGSYTFTNVTDDQTIAVSFKRISYTITATAGSGGRITPRGDVTVTVGNNQTFIIEPNLGYRISQVLVDGINQPEAVANKSYTFENVMEDHTFMVTFTYVSGQQYYINASTGTIGGTITPSGKVTVMTGDEQMFTFTPQTGYQIKEVLVDGINNPDAVIDGSYTFENIGASHTIVAKFEKQTFTITASVDGVGGTITPSGETTVTYGTNKVYTITAQTGYMISEVLIDGVNNENAVGSGRYTFSKVDDNHTIVVSFKLRTYDITATAGVGGSISPDGITAVEYGTNITYTITADAGYKIKTVLVDGKNNSAALNSGVYTFSNVKAKHTIAATFVAAPATAPMEITENNTTNHIVLYPNPTTGKITIKSTSLLGRPVGAISVFDMTGRLVLEMKNVDNNEVSLDLSNYAAGVYFINVDGKTMKVVKK